MKVLIMPNIDKVNATKVTANIVAKLTELGIEAFIDNRYRDFIDVDEKHFNEFFAIINKIDLIIAVGGDGTIIHSSKFAVEYSKPLLGVNVGRLGFLASIEPNELNLLDRLITKQYICEERMMMKVIHYNENGESEYLALNDVVVSNGALSRIIELDLICNEKQTTSYRADGIIVATPTGSTAYSLSAGGPIIDPSIDCISVTPICPHSLVARTTIFADNAVLNIKANANNLHPIYMTIDGEQGARIGSFDSVKIMRCKKNVTLINLNNRQFYDILVSKMM